MNLSKISIIAGIAALLLAGCASAPNTPPPIPDQTNYKGGTGIETSGPEGAANDAIGNQRY